MYYFSFFIFFFFLMIRRPPRSTLFPYTTLFRSERGAEADLGWIGLLGGVLAFLEDPEQIVAEHDGRADGRRVFAARHHRNQRHGRGQRDPGRGHHERPDLPRRHAPSRGNPPAMSRRHAESLKNVSDRAADSPAGCQRDDAASQPARLLSFSESLEVDRPLLDERVAAFHRLVGLIVK